MAKTTLAYVAGAICGGCATTMLDVHEELPDLLEKIDIVYNTLLMDVKKIPECDIGVWGGTVRTDEHREQLIELRGKCKTLIAFGTCAVYGGIPGLSFYWPISELLKKVYTGTKGITNGTPPKQDVPNLMRELYPADQVVEVDYYMPGCPCPPDWFMKAVEALLEGKVSELRHKTVCSECPRRMTRPVNFPIKRKIGKFDDTVVKTEKDGTVRHRCFLSQGILCLGSVTINRCGASCQLHNMPCSGCSGPSLEVLREQGRDPLLMIAKRMAILSGQDPEAIISGQIPQDIIDQFYDIKHQFYGYISTHPALWKKAASKIPDLVEVEK
ncbi:MAG: F420-nonreducing hydrogenase [Candidatus Altiarchaeota archaeon]|nr:F420-nonreducing hydrogenase [Candidatus Altiarchaeota archaeon]